MHRGRDRGVHRHTPFYVCVEREEVCLVAHTLTRTHVPALGDEGEQGRTGLVGVRVGVCIGVCLEREDSSSGSGSGSGGSSSSRRWGEPWRGRGGRARLVVAQTDRVHAHVRCGGMGMRTR
jgi:hypothetical protein